MQKLTWKGYKCANTIGVLITHEYGVRLNLVESLSKFDNHYPTIILGHVLLFTRGPLSMTLISGLWGIVKYTPTFFPVAKFNLCMHIFMCSSPVNLYSK